MPSEMHSTGLATSNDRLTKGEHFSSAQFIFLCYKYTELGDMFLRVHIKPSSGLVHKNRQRFYILYTLSVGD
jgi:hypothetical protein